MSHTIYYRAYGKKLDKIELYRRLGRIYRLLRSGKVIIVFMDRKTVARNEREEYFYGSALDNETGKKIIRINPYRNGFFNTLIHECLHLVDDDMPHGLVRQLAGKIVRQMSPSHYAYLLKLVTRNIHRQHAKRKK
ncbi:MAG: hypothetical protein AAB465_03015 [Patescibacteria group bacterium]